VAETCSKQQQSPMLQHTLEAFDCSSDCPETATAQEAITGVAGLGWGVGSSGMGRKFCGVY
jgi:hypothetical protein